MSTNFIIITRGTVGGLDRLWIGNWDGRQESIGVSYTNDTWIHLVWVHSNNMLYAYANGVLVGSTPSGNTEEINSIVKIGNTEDHRSTPFQGKIDDVRIYSRALNDAEVKQLYDSTKSCADTTAVGGTCSDGTIYAGTSPDGNVPMYTTPCDAGQTLSGTCTGTRSTKTWNNGTGNWTTTGFTSTVTGRANTTALVNLSDAGSPYNAAAYCAGLNTGGHSDWYLPAKDELNALYTQYTAIGGFEVGWVTYYWSATELTGAGASQQRFTDGAQPNHNKNTSSNVRCVRR